MLEGFITKDGYAAVPFCDKLMVIYNGEQLKVCNTRETATKFINQHRKKPQQGTVFIQ